MSKCYWENDADGLVQHRVVPNLQSVKKKEKKTSVAVKCNKARSALSGPLCEVSGSLHLVRMGLVLVGRQEVHSMSQSQRVLISHETNVHPSSTAWKPSVGVLPRDPCFTDEEAKTGSGLLRGSLSRDSGPSSLPLASNLSVHSLICPPATHPLSIHSVLRVHGCHALHQL